MVFFVGGGQGLLQVTLLSLLSLLLLSTHHVNAFMMRPTPTRAATSIRLGATPRSIESASALLEEAGQVPLIRADGKQCWEYAQQISQDVLPQLKGTNIQISAVGIGDQEAADLFATTVNFPPELLYADEAGATYRSIGFYKELGRLFFAKATRQAFQDKEKQERVKALLPIYQPGKLVPKDLKLTQQQGGLLVVKKGEILFQHFDEGTGAHADWSQVLAAAKAGGRR